MVLLGIALLPSLYAWFNIAANKDPYGNLNQVKIAVSNEDTSVPFQGEDLNAGDKIIEQLKKNDQLGWTFVDKDEAIDGVKAGKYYAAIVIPSDFSASFLSILDEGELRFPALDYYVNEKLNAIAPKITSTGLGTLESEIDSRFVAMSSEILGKKITEGREDFSTRAGDNRDRAMNSLENVGRNLQEYETVLRNMDEEMGHLGSLSRKARGDVKSLNEAVKKGELTLDEAAQLLAETRKESEAIAAAYEGLMDDMNHVARLAESYSEKKYLSLNGDLVFERQCMDRGLTDLELINDLNGSVLADLEGLSPIPKEMKPLDVLGRWREINKRNGDLLASVKEQREAVIAAEKALEKSHETIENRLKESAGNKKALGDEYRSTVVPMMNQSFDLLNQVEGHLSGTLNSIPYVLDELDRLLVDMEAMTVQSSETINTSLESISRAQDSIRGLQTDLGQLARGPLYEKIRDAGSVDGDSFATFMENPVRINEHVIYKSDNYGSAMTPFFTNLALWVGGMILISILKIDVDIDETLGHVTFSQAYCGRWMLFALVGLSQALIVSLGDLWLLKVQCARPVLFVLTALFASLAYVSIIFSLASTFRNIGKAIAVIVLILQIPGASGTYPIEMMASFFQSIYPVLPFHYGIDAMREAMLGPYQYHLVKDWIILASFLPISLLIGLVGPRIFGGLNHIFDLELAQSELIHGDLPGKKALIGGNLIPLILSGDKYALARLQEKHDAFFKSYEKRKARAFITLAVVPGLFLFLLFRMDSKIRYLVVFVASIIAFATYLIWLEFYRHRYEEEEEWMELTEEEVLKRLKGNDGYEHDFQAY